MRQLADDRVIAPLAPIGVLGSAVRALLESRGVRFVEETEYDTPGPVQWAAVELDDGAQFLVQHHYRHSELGLVISDQVGVATPTQLCRRFASALGLSHDDFSWIAEDWPS